MKLTGLIILSFILLGQMANAKEMIDSATDFHRIFTQCVREKNPNMQNAQFLHFVPNENLEAALNAPSLVDSMHGAASVTIEDLIAATAKIDSDGVDSRVTRDLNGALRKQPITLVLVPGIFGEFIKTRAFEDILSQPSKFRDQFVTTVKSAASSADKVKRDAAWSLSYSTAAVGKVKMSLDQVVHLGSINDSNGEPLVRVVLLFTPKASLETLGDLKDRAAILNSRLEKYLTLTGRQNLVLIGYSRGTTYALEMLAQAKERNSSVLANTRAMIALNGVIWGSTSADQTVDASSPLSEVVAALHKLNDSLTPIDVVDGFFSKAKKIHDNDMAWLSFFNRVAELKTADGVDFSSISESLSDKDPIKKAFFNSILSMNLPGQAVFFFKTMAELKLNSIFSEYSNNIRRAKNFISAALTGIDQLRTERRTEWWMSRTLPSSVSYYAINSVMVNPTDSTLSAEVFNSPNNFANKSFEDIYLLQNRDAYFKASGVRLNDSQVGVPQATFLPEVIRQMRPDESLQMHYLGMLGTHHWGDVLKIVFEMKDNRINGFPREALAKALAVKVALDLENSAQ